ncbi:MAG TPA: putative quinol monooxygenase [Streptosporangiaceae bacterium]|nr:putative quinol monooxygenase [Streptosporangiaceae bacterium]
MSVVVVATIKPLPEHIDAVVAAFAEVIPQVHEEDGCELYALHLASDRLIMVERWASPEALQAHSKGPNLAALNAKLAGKVAGPPEVVVARAVPGGDPAKGQL